MKTYLNLDGLLRFLDNLTSKFAAKTHTHVNSDISGLDDRYYTETEIDTKLSKKANSSHTHSAYVNQNAFSEVTVGDNTISADSATDNLTFVAGTNVTLTADTANDKITISANDTIYTHPSSGVTAGTYKSVTVDDKGHVIGGSNPTNLSGYGITDAVSDSEFEEHTGNTTVHLTSAERTKWNAGYTHSTASHAPTNAERNIIVGIQKNGSDVTVDSSTRKVNIVVPTKASDVGADAAGTASSTVSSHNTSTTAHEDIRASIESHTENVSNPHSVTKAQIGLGNVENKSSATIRGELTKANVTTALGYTPPTTNTTYGEATTSTAGLLSATDKAKLDGIATGANKTTVDSAMSSTSTNPVQNKVVNSAISSSASSTLSTAKSYTDTAISNLINSAPTTLDTLGEIATAMEENEDVVAALETAIGTKATASDLTSHTGNKSNPHGVTLSQLGVTATAAELNIMDGVTATASEINKLDGLTTTTTELNYVDGVTSNIQTQLNGKAATSHGNHVPATETANNAKFLRNDNTWAMVTPANIGAATSSHTHSSYANQNAFSNVTIGSTTIAADTTTDTLTLVAGSNVTLIPDATNDKITIAATNTVYTHPTSSGNKHIPAGGSSGQILRWYADGTAVWGADNNTTYNAATQSAAGLMSAADKTKLDGIASGANNYSLPTASSSTLGGVKTTSTITSTSGLTACPIISGVVYYKNTTYGSASTSAPGLMSAADKTKLDGIASGANNYTYTLPNATPSTLGGVKVGSNITVSSGTISLTKSNITTALGYTPPTTNTTYTAGTGISISSDNQISCTVSAYSLPSATLSTLGGVRFSYGSLSSRPSTATTGAIYLAIS